MAVPKAAPTPGHQASGALSAMLSHQRPKWGRVTAADAAAALLMLDWELVKDGSNPIFGRQWARSILGLPCGPVSVTPDVVQAFTATCDATAGLLTSIDVQDLTGRTLTPERKKAAKKVAQEFFGAASRDVFLKRWLNSTPVLSTPPTPGAIIDLDYLGQQVAASKPAKSGFLGSIFKNRR